MADLIGHMLGQYQIIEQIGTGGMATVYKAYQASMDRYVAIKVLPRQLAEDPSFIGRFEQEARTIAKLEHAHILPVHDFGEQEGYTYLVMRYIGTGTLKDRIRQGPLPLPEVVEYFRQIADALQYAHERGVIHRDVKTSNVLIGDGKQAYLTDFGIAKLAEGTAHFTGTGTIIGTPAYMSPEQCTGLPVDARSDVYSLGVVLYEMITGIVPFEAETPVAVVLKHLQEPLPSPRYINPNTPESVEKVLLRALAKKPEDRYQSALEMYDALRDAFEEFSEKQTAAAGIPAMRPSRAAIPSAEPATETLPPTRRSRRRRWMVGAGALGFVVLVLVLLSIGGHRKREREEHQTLTAEASMTQMTAAAGAIQTPEITGPTATIQQTPGAALNPGWTVFTSTRGYEPGDRKLVSLGDEVWMSSPGGLVRWGQDGSYLKYTSADGLAYNNIHTLAADTRGNLWLAGGDQIGMMEIKLKPDQTMDVVHFFSHDTGEMQSNYVWALLPDSDGDLLIGAYETYLEWWSGDGWHTPEFPVPTDFLRDKVGDRIWILLRSSESLWAGGPLGLARWDGQEWTGVPLPENLTSQNQEENNIILLYEDPSDGSIWISLYQTPDYQDYVLHLVPSEDHPGQWDWVPVENWVPVPLRSVLRTSDGTLWLVGADSVVQVTGDTHTVFTGKQGIPGDSYFDLIQDKQGTLWLSTDTAVVKYDGKRWIPYATKNEPSTNQWVDMDQADDGTLWFLSGSGAINAYDGTTWNAVENLDAESFDIEWHQQVVWVATADGLYKLDRGTPKHLTTQDGLADPFVTSLATDPTQPDRLWVGTRKGIQALNLTDGTWETWTSQAENLPGPAFTALYVDPRGVLWAGTGWNQDWTGPGEAGLVNFKDGKWNVIGRAGDPFGDDDQIIRTITGDGHGGLWVGTDVRLYHWDGSTWKRYTEDDGAPEYVGILGIVVSGDVTWIAAEYNGLYRLDSFGWYKFGREGTGTGYLNGLYQTTDGALWILSEDGISRLVGDPLKTQ